jgi:hypothetical protein
MKRPMLGVDAEANFDTNPAVVIVTGSGPDFFLL